MGVLADTIAKAGSSMKNVKGEDVQKWIGDAATKSQREGGPEGVVEFLAKLAMSIVKFVFDMISSIPMIIIGLKLFLWALLALTIVIVIILLGVYLVQYFHPRLCLLSRSAAFEDYMEKLLVESEETVFELRGILRLDPDLLLFHVGRDDERVLRCSGRSTCRPERDITPAGRSSTRSPCVLADLVEELRTEIEKLTAGGRKEFYENLEIYYKFNTTIRNLDRFVYSYFARRDILNEPRFDGGGIVDNDAVAKFKREFSEPFDRFRDVVAQISKILSTWCGLYHQEWYDEPTFRFVTHMHLLDLAHNKYREQTVFSHNTRKPMAFTLQFNVWSLYYLPYAEDTFVKRVPAIWVTMPQRFKDHLLGFGRNWVALGTHLSLMPCYLAYRDNPRERSKKCVTLSEQHLSEKAQRAFERFSSSDGKNKRKNKKAATQRQRRRDDDEQNDEGFEEEEEEEEEEEDDKNGKEGKNGDREVKGDVTEPFGFLKTLISVGTFFKTIGMVAVAMARALSQLADDPIKAIMTPILLFIGVLISMVLWFMHTMFTITQLSYIFGVIWAWNAAVVVSFWLTVLEVVFVIVLLVVFILIWIMDLLTGGLIVKLMRCESLPDEWEHRPNYAESNDSGRILGTACCYPCATRFKPVMGVVCQRLHDYIPDHCPHQQIISAFRNGETRGKIAPFMFDKYPASPAFLLRRRVQKEQMIVKALDEAKGFLGKCFSKMSRYDAINRHACSNIDRLPSDKYSDATKEKMRKLCYQVFCDYKWSSNVFRKVDVSFKNKRERGSDCLCSYLTEDKPMEHEAADTQVAKATTQKMVRRSMFLLIGLFVMLASAYTMINAADSIAFGRMKETEWDLNFKFFGMRATT